MKKFLISLIVTTSVLIHQTVHADWVEYDRVKVTSNNNLEIQNIIKKYELELHSKEKITQLTYQATHYKWQGASTCEANDPRLTYKSEIVETESQNADGSISASMYAGANKLNSDPCYTEPNDGYWKLTNRDLIEYRSERELEDFLAKRKAQFPETRAIELSYASEDLHYYSWVGRSTCSANDARLKTVVDEGIVKFNDETELTNSSFFNNQSTTDPCSLI
ncbi:MAG: hypothetical protein M9962_05780 [Oligoflexia bacterium]|nr:hypothetical protein [Oligoflexia bacterium]